MDNFLGGMDMGIPNFNFQRLPKNLLNINKTQVKKERKDSYSSKYKDKFVNEYLLNFSKKEKNKILEDLVNNIIAFRKKCINQQQSDLKERNEIASNYLLFHNLEKNLVEISYISKREHRNEKVEIVYNWYKRILDKNKILKRIKSKSYKSANEKYDLDEGNKEKENNDKVIETKEKNKNISDKNQEETNTEIIHEEKTKEVKSLKKIIKLEESFSRNERMQLSSAKIQKSDITVNSKDNVSWNFMTRCRIKKNCTNIYNFPRTNSEIISSSFITPKPNKKYIFPKIKNNFSSLENEIMDNKIKMLKEKRNMEEMNKSLNIFGISRAKFKENINNKYEMKELINMYVNNNENKTEIGNSKLLKKYLKRKIKIIKPINEFTNIGNKNNNINNTWNKNILEEKEMKSIKIINLNSGNSGIKKGRIFYGINHIKILVNNIKNINYDTKKINDNKDNINYIDIKMKICGNDIKINNLLSKSTDINSDNLIKDVANQFISSDLLIKKKYSNANRSYDTIKKEDISIYKTDFNNTFDNDISEEEKEETKEAKKEDKKDYENDYYYNEKEKYKKHFDIGLSLFDKNNIKKIQLYKNRQKNYNIFKRYKTRLYNLNEKKKVELYNNYKHNKSDFLSIRKKMEILNKIDFKQINAKNENIFFRNSFRYDNIDEDKKITDDNNLGKEAQDKNENIFNKRFCLSKALIEPKNNNFFPLFYLPRPGSKLLIKK